tara:strand:- start:281 stop:844 length:564 start_codon:yes stop_codon:yes gene_type:complete
MTEIFSKVGTLIFVVGPSGSGKDTLINGAKGLVSNERFTFITREITRSADAGGEDHIEITKRDFDRKVKAGQYALHWQANGHCYGINKELNQLLCAGKTIVLNGSRAAVSTAGELYPQLQIVQINVPLEILRKRLKERNRETEQEIEARLSRATEWRLEKEGLRHFSNDQPIELSIKSFVSLLNRIS